MGTTRIFQRGVLVLALAGLLAGYGLAAERAPAINESSSDMNAATPPMMGGQSADLVRASRVVGAKVKSPQGETLGHVSDIVLTPDLDSVSYVALSHGGIFGMGNLMYAVPWSALSSGINGSFVIPVTKQQLEQSRGFDQDNWPSRPSAAWMVQDQQYLYGKQDINGGSVFSRRFSRLKGTNVKASAGDNVGDITDLAIAMNTGQIAYTIVSSGGILGLGQRLAAIPQNAITLEPALRTARVDAPKAVVRANSFTPGRWPALASPSYSEQLAAAYGVASTGAALAFVPPEDTTAVARAPRTTAPAARSTTPPVGGTMPSAMEEPKAADLTGTFNASNITTIEGTVIGAGKFQPATGSEMLWLRVRPESGEPVLVNLGPRSYIGAENFYIVPGDRIHLTGSKVAASASGKQVFLPTEVRYNGQTLRLRSATGTPLWEGAAGAAATPPLGYAPAESQTATGAGTAAGQTATRFTPAEIITADAIDLANSRTIEGTVIEVGKSGSATRNAASASSSQATGIRSEVIWLRVRTMDGQTLNVQLGPRDYISRQNFFVVNGDRVRLTGWNARSGAVAGAMGVFVPAEISLDGQTLQLRNRSGEPLWTTPAGRAGQARDTQMPSQETATPGAMDTSRATDKPATETNEADEP